MATARPLSVRKATISPPNICAITGRSLIAREAHNKYHDGGKSGSLYAVSSSSIKPPEHDKRHRRSPGRKHHARDQRSAAPERQQAQDSERHMERRHEVEIEIDSVR